MSKQLVTDQASAIYFYPTGEKDDAIIFIAYEQTMASLTINPYTNDYTRDFYDLSESNDSIEEQRTQLAREKFEQWLKN